MGIVNYVLFEAWSWVPWVLGLGTIGWIILALLAPGVLSVISPLLRGLAEGFVELWKVLYEGLIDILDNWKTVVTVMILGWLLINYFTWKKQYDAEGVRTPTVTSKNSKPQKVAPSQKKEKPTFSLDGWDWFHSK